MSDRAFVPTWCACSLISTFTDVAANLKATTVFEHQIHSSALSEMNRIRRWIITKCGGNMNFHKASPCWLNLYFNPNLQNAISGEHSNIIKPCMKGMTCLESISTKIGKWKGNAWNVRSGRKKLSSFIYAACFAEEGVLTYLIKRGVEGRTKENQITLNHSKHWTA